MSTGAGATRGRVLVVEDDEDLADVLSETLAAEGYDVAVAPDGQAALEALETGPVPAVILLDLLLPRVGGLEFRARQLQDPQLAGIPTFVMTGADIKPSAVGVQVSGWLRKPVHLEEVLALLSEHCRA